MTGAEAKAWAEAHAGEVWASENCTVSGRVVAWKSYDDDMNAPGGGYVVIEGRDTGRRETRLFGGTNVVPDARCGTTFADLARLHRVGVTVKTPPDNYPGKCPRCRAPAYVGLVTVDCSAGCGK